MPYKISILIGFSTAPSNRAVASIHSGGWSESFWFNGAASLITIKMPLILNDRARMLGGSASVVGYRIQAYTITGNKLIPNGSTSVHATYPGNNNLTMDVPQAALDLSGLVAGAVNSNRLVLRGVPDEAITFGEYNGSQPFAGGLANYTGDIVNMPAGFVGRDLSQPSSRIHAINAGVVTLQANVGGVAGTDWLRLHRCYDINGNPVKGAYLITAIAGNAYTLQNLPAQVVLEPSGTARIDKLVFLTLTSLNTGRALVKKVGRPFEQYRGRRSHARV